MDALGAPKQPPYYQPGRPPRAFNIHPTHTQIRQMHEKKKKGSGNARRDSNPRPLPLAASRCQGCQGCQACQGCQGCQSNREGCFVFVTWSVTKLYIYPFIYPCVTAVRHRQIRAGSAGRGRRRARRRRYDELVVRSTLYSSTVEYRLESRWWPDRIRAGRGGAGRRGG